ncbi:MAG TPA: M23 family metallopeptidase, partial [Polymorphobacter sp.]|nr:M23 family metallopeptidase [Polymorphobacter sp.]
MANHLIATVAALLLGAAAMPLAAQSLKADEVLSSLALRPISMPNPVAGSDGRTHLAYELVASNASKLFLTLDRVELVDPAGSVVSSLAGPALAAMATLYSGEGTTIAPGGTAIIFLDAAFAGALPASVTARVTLTRQIAGPDGKPAPFPKTEPVPATITFSGATATPGKPAVVIAPPLRGPNWVAVNGCCDAKTSHRGAVMVVNGTLRVPERFAIDWVRLDSQHRLYTGKIDQLASYAYFGTPVHAVADGTVVNIYTSAVEQVPGADAKGITTQNIGGNMLVIDIGGGNFAFFAHLQPGSLRVKLGDKVKTGDVIA